MYPLIWLVQRKIAGTKTGSTIDRLASAPFPSSWGFNPSNNSSPNDWKYFWGLTLVAPVILLPFTMALTPAKNTATQIPLPSTTPTETPEATSVNGISQVFW